MNQTAIGLLLASMFATVGLAFLIVARRLAKLTVWWQSQVSRLPMFKSLAKIASYDERTSVTIIRVFGVAGIVAGFLAAIIVIALEWRA